MSDLTEKLTPVASSEGPARRTLESLKKARGFVVLVGPDDTPQRVSIVGMTATSWMHVSGRGLGAVYELEANE
jgi:hypothetical protein